ncbi:ribonuclease R [Meiothermus sp. QL-1]|uniref:ribonuclease R n=1 Tax=Meiothermus sp. QL-1 TaxID=2058095 RepID=UPI000E0A9CD5|nr:ribonuclease R [Meiothermus sp. QL-1]RDI96513.1 ribonuclease R [Meiothermus sp. QL-1]
MLEQRIYEFLKKQPKKRFSLREVVRGLRLDKDEAKEALAMLVAEGKVLEPRRKLYELPEAQTEKGFVGHLQAHPAGFAFVVPTNPALPDLYIPKGHLGGSWHGDRVRAETRPPGKDGRPWGVVVEVLERALHQVVGRLYFKKGYAWLKPDDPRLPALKLKPEGLEGLEAGARLLARVVFPPKGEPYGEVQAYLGQGEGPEVETEAIIAKYGLQSSFSPEALAEAERVAHLDPAEVARREDFRSLRVFTIDGADAKDFDDAIHIEVLPNGNYRVGIHIADVSHYVREGSPLDQEAYARATSVYLPGRVLPMLPEALSNGICSLKPGEDRLVLSVLVELSPEGKVRGYRFAEGVIRSVARLTYEAVEAFAEAKEKGTPLPEEAIPPLLHPDLSLLLELTQTLKARRLEQGALDFNFSEVRVEVDPEGNLHLIPLREPRARSLIEELMLLANRIVAKHLAERNIPALFRVHEDPSQEAYTKLVNALEKLGYRLPGGEPSPKALQAVLKQAEGRPEAPVVSTLLLRSLRLARYAAENLGHFGLAAEHYLHFTSPIRRYPDLVVHRVLRTLLRRRATKARKEAWAQRFPLMAQHVSERERAAESAERELSRYYQCLWALRHRGEVYTGTVSGVTNFGVFVTLPNGVEGLVRLAALRDDLYHYHEELLALEGLKTKRRIRIGDEMEVKIEGANPSARQIDLEPAEAKPKDKKPKRKVGASEPKSPPPHARARPKRVVGPPEERRGFVKPVKVRLQKVYFGAWGENNPVGDAKTPSGKKRRKRRKKAQVAPA